MKLERETILAISDLVSELAIAMEAIGIMGRGHEIAILTLDVMTERGWQLTQPHTGRLD